MPYGFNSFEDFLHIPDETYEYQDYKQSRSPVSLNSLYFNTNDFCLGLDGLIYTKIIELYESLFPRCHVFLYEDMVTSPKDTIERLSTICEENFVQKTAKENLSLAPKDLARIQRRNVINRIQGKFLRETMRVVCRLAPVLKTQDIKAKSAELIGDYFTSDNQDLKTRLPSVDWSKHKGKYV